MAERGIPALLIWVAFVLSLGTSLLKLFRNGERLLAATGLAAVVAMITAGMFEYNFGDSEFLMTFLVMVTLPFATARDDNARRAAAADRA
jgi:O-antigen ligase